MNESELWEAIKDGAQRAGERAGRNLAGWWQQDAIGGRASGDAKITARTVLDGLEEGDPAIWDGIPSLDLSGEMADGWNVSGLLDAVSFELQGEVFDHFDQLRAVDWNETVDAMMDELVNAFRDSHDQAVIDEVSRMCQLVLED